MNEYDISEAFRRIENDLIDSLIRNLSRHRAEETKEGYDWDAWQVLQLRELEKYRNKNRHRFDDQFEDINLQIVQLYQDAHEDGEKQILDDILMEDFKKPTFGINSERLDALIKATTDDLEKAEHAVLRKANDEYRKIIFDAQVYANQGGTYEKAVDMATKDFRKRGIQSIVYKNGARHNISDYAEMALRTGGKRAYLMGLGQQMARIGIHTIRVNKRDGACPFCTPWLGRVLVDDVYNEGTKEEARQKGLPLLSEAIEEGFLHPNCKDIYSMYIEGVSEPEDPLTDEEKDLMQKVYDLEQELKKAQGIHDSYYRMALNSLDPTDWDRYSVLVNKWGDRIDELEKELAELKGQMPSDVPDIVPPIDHSGIREFIEVERDTVTKGVFEIPDGVISIGEQEDSWEYETSKGQIRRTDRWGITLNKQISLPWEGFGQRGRNSLRWNLPDYRYEKPFLIQKKDFEYGRLEKRYVDGELIGILRNSQRVKWFEENGYTWLGDVSISKYNTPWIVGIGEKNGKYSIIIDDLVEEDGVIRTSTIDKILDREKIVSKQLWDKGVPFRDITSRGDKYNREVEKKWQDGMVAFHTAIEADKPVSLVSQKLYDELQGEEIYRGIAQESWLRQAVDTPPPIDCARQLMEGGVGDCYPSKGIYGDGVGYWSNSTRIGDNYASGSRGVIVRAKIKDDAKTILYEDAVKLFHEIHDAHPDDGQMYFSTNQRRTEHEVGKAMQMLGYDVIIKPDGDFTGETFYIILNREALVGVADDYIWKLIG